MTWISAAQRDTSPGQAESKAIERITRGMWQTAVMMSEDRRNLRKPKYSACFPHLSLLLLPMLTMQSSYLVVSTVVLSAMYSRIEIAEEASIQSLQKQLCNRYQHGKDWRAAFVWPPDASL